MTLNIQQGLLGVAFASMTMIILTHSAAGQFPMPEFQAPAPVLAKPSPQAAQSREVETLPSETLPAVSGQPDAADSDVRFQLVESVSSSSDLAASQPTAAELRQARAQYRSQQRAQRMERNLWAGYEPLRPNWNSIPMMSSRYPDRSTIYVPIYVYPR